MSTPTLEHEKHFDHDNHLRRLEAAERVLRDLGRDDLAGAVSRAASLHRDLQGRVAHAAHAMRQLDLADEQLGGPNLDEPETERREPCLESARSRIRKARGLLDRYVARRNAPWLTPAPVLFPEVDHIAAGMLASSYAAKRAAEEGEGAT